MDDHADAPSGCLSVIGEASITGSGSEVGVRVGGPTTRTSDWRLEAWAALAACPRRASLERRGRVVPSERSARRLAKRQNDPVDGFRLIPNVAHCEILVNDVPLLDLVTERERRLRVDHAGDYLLLPGELALFPSRYLVGEPTVDSSEWGTDWESWGFGKHMTAIAGCTCGSVGCSPLLVSIELERGVVIWHDFVSSPEPGLSPRLHVRPEALRVRARPVPGGRRSDSD